jgi:glycosyltransferase involved in cell wall biosynthesis
VRILFVTSLHPTRLRPVQGIIVLRLAEALRGLGLTIETCPIGERSGWGAFRYVLARRRVRDHIRQFEPDIVHIHFGYSGVALPWWRGPVVTTFNGDDLNGTSRGGGGLTWKSRLGLLASQLTAARSDRIVVVSEGLRARLWSSSARRRTSVIPDAVDPLLFQPRRQLVARKRLGIDVARRLVLFPHDDTQPTKRLWLAQAAVRELRSTVPEVELWIVNGVPPDEMPWYYAAADVLIVTSTLEGGPSCVKEALACGLPVVSVAVGDVELLTGLATGGPVAAEPVALSDRLLKILRDQPDERHSLLPEHLELGHVAARMRDEVYRPLVRPSVTRAASEPTHNHTAQP